MGPRRDIRGIRGIRARAAAVVAAALALLAIPSAAQALTVSGTATPTNPAAGANSNLNIHIDFGSPGDQVKDLTVGLPPGMVGDPTATPKCTVAQLNADACDANTVVGDVSAVANILGIPLPVTATGNLYNLDPQPGEPARFGIVLHAAVGDPIILQSGAELRSSDFGLNTIIKDIPNTTLLPGDTDIVSQDIHLYGIAPGTGKPFMRNPTSCVPATTAFSADSYVSPNTTVTGQAPPFTPTNCGALDFSPSFSAAVQGVRMPGDQAGIRTSIDQDLGEAGLRTAHVVTPTDFGANFARLANLCPLADFQAGSCPANSVVGSAIATSPLLTQPLAGPVTLLQGLALPNIGLDLNGQLHFLLEGSLGFDNSVTFDGLPDIPISHFQLTFDGPPQGLLIATRDLCKPPPPLFHEDFFGYNGTSSSLDTAATVENCGPLAKCKAKKKHKKNNRAVAAKKKHKKRACKKKHKKRK
jgi:hypothetical protein